MYCLVHSVLDGILALEILHQPGAVELAGAEVAGQRRQPAAAEQAARIAHRVLAVHAGPIGKRRAGDDDRPEEFGPQRGEDHDRPAGLAVAYHAWLSVGVGMPLDDLLDEDRLGARDAFDGLARHRFGQEPNEVAGMARLHGDADLAVGLEAADSGAVASAGIDHDERPAFKVDLNALGRDDAHQRVVDRLVPASGRR